MTLLETFQKGRIIDSRYQIVHSTLVTENCLRASALDLRLDKMPVTLKIFHAQQKTNRNELERFRAEVILTRKLSHPAIEAVYDIGRFESTFFFISSQVVEGISLSDLKSQLDSREVHFALAVELLYQLLDALHTSHQNGVIHRNIVPENVFIALNGSRIDSVTLTNFGLGKRFEKDLGLTNTGEAAITPSIYTSPEQMIGKTIDNSTDLYSLGMLIIMLLSNVPITKYSSGSSATLELCTENLLPELEKNRPDLPSWFFSILNRLTIKNRQNRYQSAREVQKHILEHLGYTSRQLFRNPAKSKYTFTVKPLLKAHYNVASHKLAMILGLAFLGVLAAGIPVYWIRAGDFIDGAASTTDQLIEAVTSGNEAEVFRLLSQGVSPKTSDPEGTPLLHLAIMQNDLATIYTLVSSKPEIIYMKNSAGKNALEIAKNKASPEAISLLERFQQD
jgi:serine/threonine protein kinase